MQGADVLKLCVGMECSPVFYKLIDYGYPVADKHAIVVIIDVKFLAVGQGCVVKALQSIFNIHVESVGRKIILEFNIIITTINHHRTDGRRFGGDIIFSFLLFIFSIIRARVGKDCCVGAVCLLC